MHDNVINVFTNMDQSQSILSWIPYDEAIIKKYFLSDAWIWITLYVMSKHGDVCFTRFDQNDII